MSRGKASVGIYDILKGKFLTDESAFKNWQMIIYVIGLLLVMIWSAHLADEKVAKISKLHKKQRELKEIYIDTKKMVALIKLESSVREKVYKTGLAPAKVPPKKIKVVITK